MLAQLPRLKAGLRKAAERTIPRLRRRIGRVNCAGAGRRLGGPVVAANGRAARFSPPERIVPPN